MNKKLNSTFCTLAVTAMVSVAMLSGCSGTTAAPGASDTDQASTTAVAGGDKSMGEASMEAENTDAGIESKDTDGQKLKVMASFYPMYDFVEHLEEYRIAGKNYRTHISLWDTLE